MPPKTVQARRTEEATYARPLTLKDLDAVLELEEAARKNFQEQGMRAWESLTREEIIYRLTVCPELSLGVFTTRKITENRDIGGNTEIGERKKESKIEVKEEAARDIVTSDAGTGTAYDEVKASDLHVDCDEIDADETDDSDYESDTDDDSKTSEKKKGKKKKDKKAPNNTEKGKEALAVSASTPLPGSEFQNPNFLCEGSTKDIIDYNPGNVDLWKTETSRLHPVLCTRRSYKQVLLAFVIASKTPANAFTERAVAIPSSFKSPLLITPTNPSGTATTPTRFEYEAGLPIALDCDPVEGKTPPKAFTDHSDWLHMPVGHCEHGRTILVFTVRGAPEKRNHGYVKIAAKEWWDRVTSARCAQRFVARVDEIDFKSKLFDNVYAWVTYQEESDDSEDEGKANRKGKGKGKHKGKGKQKAKGKQEEKENRPWKKLCVLRR